MTLTFTNLTPVFYDVYVYGNVNGGPVDLDMSIGATTNYWTEPAAFDVGTGFIQASSSDPNARAAGNYVQFTGVTPASGLITITATYQNGSDGLGIAGVQIVSSAAFPAIATLQPNLAAALEGGQIVISWNSPASFQLQYRTDLSLGRWTDESTPALVIGDQHTVRLPATSLAARECVSSHDNALALPYLPARIAFAIRNCSLLTAHRTLGHSMAFQSDTLLEDAPKDCSFIICFSSSRMVRQPLLQRET